MVAGVAVRLVWLAFGSGDARFLFADSSSYLDVAAGFPGGFASPSDEALVAQLYRTPGYPTFLWLLGGSWSLLPAIVGQAALGGAGTVWLGHRLTDRLLGPRAALVAAVVLAFDPASITHSLLIATETLTAAGLLVAALLVHRAHQALCDGTPAHSAAALAGLALGMVALVRPSVSALPIVLGLVLGLALRTRRALVCGLLIAAVGLAPVGLLVARNAALAGEPLLSTTEGQNLLDSGLAASVASRGDLPVRPADRDTMAGLIAEAYEREVSAADRAALTVAEGGRSPVDRALEIDRVQSRIGRKLLAAHPTGAVVVAGQAATRTFASSGHGGLQPFLPPARWEQVRVPLAAVSGAWLLALYAAVVAGGLTLARRRCWWVLALTVGFAAAYLLSSAGPWTYVRFRVPVTPFLAVLAAAGVEALTSRRRPGHPGAEPEAEVGSDLGSAG